MEKKSRNKDLDLINNILKIWRIWQCIVLTEISDHKLTPFLIVIWGQLNQICLFHDGSIKGTTKKLKNPPEKDVVGT